MCCFRFGKIEIACKPFFKQKQVADIFTIIANKVGISDKCSCNNVKGW